MTSKPLEVQDMGESTHTTVNATHPLAPPSKSAAKNAHSRYATEQRTHAPFRRFWSDPAGTFRTAQRPKLCRRRAACSRSRTWRCSFFPWPV